MFAATVHAYVSLHVYVHHPLEDNFLSNALTSEKKDIPFSLFLDTLTPLNIVSTLAKPKVKKL